MKLIHILLAVPVMLIGSVPAQAQAVHGQGTWESTLLGRDINRNAVSATDASAVYLYDTTLNVTWLRDANANVTGKVTADAYATSVEKWTGTGPTLGLTIWSPAAA